MDMSDIRVLIVDDVPAIRRLLRRMLNEMGIGQVHEAGDGVAGLARVDEIAPDIVLCDLFMEPMDGFELIKTLKQGPAGDRAAVIVLTAHADADFVRMALNWGVAGYLLKPVSRAMLEEKIAHVLKSRTAA
jgi:two-component system chemotaxis response regulator CheY